MDFELKKLLKVPWEPWKCPYIDISGLCSLFFLIQVILKGNIKLIYHVNFIFIPELFILICSVFVFWLWMWGLISEDVISMVFFLKPFINYSTFLIRLSEELFPFQTQWFVLNNLQYDNFKVINYFSPRTFLPMFLCL